jgi:arginyl-tRNA synthetase
MEERGIEHDPARGLAALALASEPQEQRLIRRISSFAETIEHAAVNRAPHTLVHYLRDLANDFHTYYSAHQFLVDDPALRDARVSLAFAAQVVIRNGLRLLGVSAPDTM